MNVEKKIKNILRKFEVEITGAMIFYKGDEKGFVDKTTKIKNEVLEKLMELMWYGKKGYR